VGNDKRLTKLLSDEVSTLLADKESGRVGVGTEVVGADREVDALEILRAEDVEALVDNTALLAGFHRAGAERVPGGLDVVGDPVVNRLVVLRSVGDVLVHLVGVVRLGGNVPGTHMDADGETVGVDLLGGLNIDVLRRGRRRRVEARVMRGELATVRCEVLLLKPNKAYLAK
jgi:hypothetical protein